MKNFLDKDGRQAKIEKGCSFIWDPNNTEMFSATPIMDGRSSFRWNGDNKRLARFLKNRSDFIDFVQIIAEFNGLKPKITRDDSQLLVIELV